MKRISLYCPDWGFSIKAESPSFYFIGDRIPQGWWPRAKEAAMGWADQRKGRRNCLFPGVCRLKFVRKGCGHLLEWRPLQGETKGPPLPLSCSSDNAHQQMEGEVKQSTGSWRDTKDGGERECTVSVPSMADILECPLCTGHWMKCSCCIIPFTHSSTPPPTDLQDRYSILTPVQLRKLKHEEIEKFMQSKTTDFRYGQNWNSHLSDFTAQALKHYGRQRPL